ncbi:Gdap1 [Carabus blaptoides fortunei]
MSANVGDGSHRINITNGLLLYYNHYSFYSQKVVMALHEKRLNFESNIINIMKGGQYEPWFLQINPRGEVPVLQDDAKIIPDSNRIIDYLEDNFSNGDTPRLIPLDQGSEIRQKVNYFRNIIDEIPANVVTIGSFFHPKLVDSPKIPFIAPVRRQMAAHERNTSKLLRTYAEKNLESREILLQKAIAQDKKHLTITNLDEYLKLLDQVDNVLTKVEEELAKHVAENQSDWWLCSDRFTVADIALTILLDRLNNIGLDTRFWAKGKRPHIERYYEKVKKRDSYKQTIPSKMFFFKMIFGQSPVFVGFSVVALLSLMIGGVFVVKKYII